MPQDNRQTILIVDDTALNVQVLNETLHADYRVLFATNGIEALKVAAEAKPDLILLDIMMPEMDGYEVCRRLKGDAALQDIPVIFVTALIEERQERQGLGLGAVDYITKPFNPGIVSLRVRNQMELKSQRDRLTKLVSELQDALAKVKLLSGFIPICASCKKIRDDEGFWTQIEQYIAEHSEAHFSHGICPDCARKLYPELDLSKIQF
jgi:PleD family two-component response regulator